MHIFLPCEGIEYDNTRKIGEYISKSVHELVPNITTKAVLKKNRGDKLYVAPSQNDFADRMAVAYCLRSFVSPNVSTPLLWNEIDCNLAPLAFNLKTIHRRLQRLGNVWAGLLIKSHRKDNSRVLK